jgi:hypothetical protein
MFMRRLRQLDDQAQGGGVRFKRQLEAVSGIGLR